MFRRRTPDPAAVAAPEAGPAAGDGSPGPAGSGRTPGKGRPTPKRSEAEKNRRQPFTTPPADRRAASKQSRTRTQAARRKRMEAMKRGEDWALPPRERGPLRTLARNYVDSRRTLSEYYLIALIPFTVLLFRRSAAERQILLYSVVVIVGILLIETSYHGSRLLRIARQRYPGESTKGLRLYMARRMITLRATRMPGPVVKPGAEI